MIITNTFKDKALDLLKIYQTQGMPVVNQGKTYLFRDFDLKRMEGIPTINGLIQDFLNAKIDLIGFKESHDTLCRKYNYWGMSGFSGQMFLNQLVNWSNASKEMTGLLRKALKVPKSRLDCANIIDEVTNQLPRLIPRKGIRLASVSTILSYFWQIQNPSEFPVFHSSARNVLKENELIDENKTSGQQFLDYWAISDELFSIYSVEVDLKGVNKHWFVEHVLWVEHRKLITPEISPKSVAHSETFSQKQESWRNFIPPVLIDFESFAFGKDSLQFERQSILLFKMLGFQVEGIGQGKGREPDGVARWNEGHYAVLFDAKSSTEGFSLGTGDRSIIEYINKYELKLRREGMRAIYFILISGDFKMSSNTAINNIRKETPARSVILLTAEQALKILSRRIKEPFTFGLDALEDLFLDSGLISEEKLEEFLIA